MSANATVFIVSARPAEVAASTQVVRGLGYEPVAFDSATACLDALRETEPLAVLVDFDSAPIRGDECCRRIKEDFDWRRTPVLMLTDGGQAHEVMYCWRAAADDFVVRPATAERLGPKLAVLRDGQAVADRERQRTGASCLLVEPGRFIRKLLGGSLEQAGIQVLYASEGAEALDLLEEHGSLDAAVVDLAIQDMDGVELLSRLRGEGAQQRPRLLAISSKEHPPAVRERVRELTGEEPIDHRQLPFDVILSRICGSLRSDLVDLRASQRAPFFCVVEFSQDGQNWSTGFSYDISAGGIFVRTLTPAGAARKVQLRAKLAGRDEPTASEGVVAWANPYRPRLSFAAPVGMGIRLISLSPQLQSHVAGLMSSLNAPVAPASSRNR